MQDLMEKAIEITIILFGILFVPCFFEMPLLLHLWLGIVPAHAVDFCRILLFLSIISLINNIVNIGIHATGNIKNISFITGSILLINLPAVYIFFKFKFGVNFAYYTLVVVNIFVLTSDLIILKLQISSIRIMAVIWCIFKSLFVVMTSAIPTYILNLCMQESFGRLCSIIIINSIVLLSFAYFYLLDTKTKEIIKRKLISHF